jgi:Helix-turn-helix domain
MLKAYRYKLEPNQSQRYALARRLENLPPHAGFPRGSTR